MSDASTMDSPSVARLDQVTKTYRMGEVTVHALQGVSLDFRAGESVSVMGPSGGGKSTLMNVLGCLDPPTSGRYHLGDRDVSLLNDDELSEIRGLHLGFIFQSYNLIQQLSVVENIEVPLFYRGRSEHESREISTALAERVGLADRMNHRPYELSGGQQQRVAIARALANDPLVILADEPTGNLDSSSGGEILKIFDELHEQGKTIIMVTHSEEVAEHSTRIIRLRDGKLIDDARH